MRCIIIGSFTKPLLDFVPFFEWHVSSQLFVIKFEMVLVSFRFSCIIFVVARLMNIIISFNFFHFLLKTLPIRRFSSPKRLQCSRQGSAWLNLSAYSCSKIPPRRDPSPTPSFDFPNRDESVEELPESAPEHALVSVSVFCLLGVCCVVWFLPLCKKMIHALLIIWLQL